MPREYFAVERPQDNSPAEIQRAFDELNQILLVMARNMPTGGTADEITATSIETSITQAAAAAALQHTQDTDTVLVDADGDTKIQVEESSDEDKIRMDVEGTEGFVLDDSAVLTLAQQSGCSVRLVSDQTITSGATGEKLGFRTEIYDIQNEFDSATNLRFTAKTAGKYLVSVIGEITSVGDQDQVGVKIYVNGGDVASVYTAVGGAGLNDTLCVVKVLDLNVNDYVEGWISHNYGSDRVADAADYWNIMTIAKVA